MTKEQVKALTVGDRVRLLRAATTDDGISEPGTIGVVCEPWRIVPARPASLWLSAEPEHEQCLGVATDDDLLYYSIHEAAEELERLPFWPVNDERTM